MQPQQTDVLDVDGPAVTPSIIEGANAPASLIVYEDELFGDNPVTTGPVAIVEPTTGSEPSDVFDFEPVAPAAPSTTPDDDSTPAPAPEAEPAPAEGTEPPEDADAALAEDAAPDVVPAAAAAKPEGDVSLNVADGEPALDVENPVERVQPPQPELEFTLEQLEAETPGASEKAATPDATPADADEFADDEAPTPPSEPTVEPEAEQAPAIPDPAPAAAVALPETDPALAAEPVTAEPAAAPTKTATYEEIQNSEQEFVGAIKAKKFPLIDPDQFWVMIAAVVALGVILAANLTASFTSVYAMAEYTGAPKSVQWVPVVALDFAIVGFSWALMVFGARGDKVWSTRLYLFVVTGFSVVANFMHTYTHWKGDLSSPEAIFGVVFSSAVPLFSLVATEELIRLVFIRRNRRKTKKAVA